MQQDFYFLDFAETKTLFGALDDGGIEARFVGGCVRDALVGDISEDFDVAANGDIYKIAETLRKRGVKCIETGIKYGSITALVGEKKFEVTSLRIDLECSGRHCKIGASASFEEDAKRRDFTINALYLSDNGKLFDYFGGLQDLQNRRVRFIGNARDRIREDYLRIFRYYRFCSKYGDLSDEYCDVISAESEGIKLLSIERIQKELFKILMSPHVKKILEIMVKNGVLGAIFGNIKFDNMEIATASESLEMRLFLLFDYDCLMHTLKLSRKQKFMLRDYKRVHNFAYNDAV